MTKERDMARIKEIKKLMIETSIQSKQGHIPSSLSSLEILYLLYNKITNITPKNAKDINRDKVIISKEHCRLGQICVLAECGLLKKEYLNAYVTDGGVLGHDIYNIVSEHELDAIDVSIGSLGHGLNVGAGLAWNNDNNVYVIVGDGELQEGSCWEAILFAGHHQILNLTIIIDRNNQQIDDTTQNIIDSSTNVKQRVESFGFEVIECDGHNIEELESAFSKKLSKPKCILANTIKGKEMLFIKDKYSCAISHWHVPTNEEAEIIIKEIEND